MRLTQILAFLNGEVPRHRYDRLSHFDPSLCWDDFREEEQLDSDKMVTNDTEAKEWEEIKHGTERDSL